MKQLIRPVLAALLILTTALLLPRYAYAAPTLVTVDSAGVTGRYTSLALDAGGSPVISYFDQTNLDLRLAVCNDPT
ncbi:MAG: hypothetical protein GYB64_04005, partial [Chloroflexi bacterium]|nr:hypothetical protein [Chloroflexota bacterium]